MIDLCKVAFLSVEGASRTHCGLNQHCDHTHFCNAPLWLVGLTRFYTNVPLPFEWFLVAVLGFSPLLSQAKSWDELIRIE